MLKFSFRNIKILITVAVFLILIFSIVIYIVPFFQENFGWLSEKYIATEKDEESEKDKIQFPTVKHLEIPDEVKTVYMTACVAATPSFRSRLVSLVEETEINSIIIDVKDYSGTISFPTENPLLTIAGKGAGCVARDMKEFIEHLHDKNIYVIARITVFQDPLFVKNRPDLAVKKLDQQTVWKDYKGISFVDAGAKEFWDYIVELGKESYNLGFDELNFDYIRFPSDGNMADIYYPFSEEKINTDPDLGKARVIRNFFAYLNRKLTSTAVFPKGRPLLSADLFGMTTTNADDLNIGQILEYALPYFDFIAPMVYPSHYPPNFIGYSNPAKYPYEIIKYSMDKGVEKVLNASSTPLKLRPWLQDFDLGADYTADMVRAQINATYDAGLTSWMLWDPRNVYTKGALLPASE